MVRLTDHLDMTILVDCDVKPQIKQNKNLNCQWFLKCFRRVSARIFVVELHEILCSFSAKCCREKKKGVRKLTRKLAVFSPQKFALENFCSQSEHVNRDCFLG